VLAEGTAAAALAVVPAGGAVMARTRWAYLAKRKRVIGERTKKIF